MMNRVMRGGLVAELLALLAGLLRAFCEDVHARGARPLSRQTSIETASIPPTAPPVEESIPPAVVAHVATEMPEAVEQVIEVAPAVTEVPLVTPAAPEADPVDTPVVTEESDVLHEVSLSSVEEGEVPPVEMVSAPEEESTSQVQGTLSHAPEHCDEEGHEHAHSHAAETDDHTHEHGHAEVTDQRAHHEEGHSHSHAHNGEVVTLDPLGEAPVEEAPRHLMVEESSATLTDVPAEEVAPINASSAPLNAELSNSQPSTGESLDDIQSFIEQMEQSTASP